MKVQDLLKEIKKCRKEYKDFLSWDIYTEQLEEADKEYKRGEQKWGILIGHDQGDDTEYFDCAGGIGIWKEKKALCIHVNY